jgi:hypothetical protein
MRKSFARVMKAVTCSAFLFLATGNSQAATVISVGTVELVAKSDFIFQGKVIEEWVAAGPRSGSILTFLRFSVSDVLKGAAARSTVVLSYLGGVLDGRILTIEGMEIPSVGEEGVFFVEHLGRNQIHPLYGWDQGRFLIRRDTSGRASVYTHDMKPIGRVDMVKATPGISDGVAPGIVVASDGREALSLDAFKARIRTLVEAQQ